MHITDTASAWPSTTSLWQVENWAQNKVIRTYTNLDHAQTCAESLIRQQLGKPDLVVEWRNGCCCGEGCDACFSDKPHRPAITIDATYINPETGTRVADYRLMEVIAYQECDLGELPDPGSRDHTHCPREPR